MSEKILGLELSNSGLAAVVIKKSFKQSTIIDACFVPFPVKNDQLELAAQDGISTQQGTAVKNIRLAQKIEQKLMDTQHLDLQALDQAVGLILSKLDLKGCSTSALCLPSSFISFRTLNMPFSSESKIREILPFEISSRLPINSGRYTSDFIVINRREESSHIFTASILSELIDICFSVLKKHGLQPEIIVPQGFAAPICTDINLSYSKQHKIESTLFAKRVYDADVFVETTPYNTVISVSIAGTITAIRSFMNRTDFDKKENFSKHTAFVQKAIAQTLKGVSQRYDIEISPSIFDYVNIMEHLNIDIEDSVVLSNDVQWFNAISAALCCVKRIKTINFCQGGYAKSSFFHKFKHNLLVLSVFASFAFLSLFMNIQYDTINLKQEVATLDKAIRDQFVQTFPDVKTVVEPLMQMQVKLKEAESQIGGGLGKRGGLADQNIKVLEILYELSNRIPQSLDVEVSRILISEGKVVIAGTTDNFNSVDQIKSVIEKYDRFKSVTINSASADKSGNRVLFNFIIEVM